jgi:uncharacterized protein YggE
MNMTFSLRRPVGFSLAAIMLVGLALVFSPLVSAQTPEPGAETITRTISVSGTGVVKVDPDTASISLGVIANDESLEVAQETVSTGLASITQSLTDAGIAAEDIQTNSYSVYPVPEYDRDGNYVGVERYEVSAGLTVIVRDIDSVGTVLDDAVEAGANNVWGISFYVEDPSAAASQARQAAVEDARGKADELATAGGMVVVNIVSISESFAPEPTARQFDFPAADMAMEAGGSAAVPVSPGQTDVRVEVQVVFEIEAAAG